MRLLLAALTAGFTAFTAFVISRTGLVGFFEQLLSTSAGWQTLVDVTIALSLVLAWMWQDARRQGRAFWPWVPVTLLLGSIGPLLYLLLRPAQREQQARVRVA